MRFNNIFDSITIATMTTEVEELEFFVLEFGNWIDESLEEGAIDSYEHKLLVAELLDAETRIA